MLNLRFFEQRNYNQSRQIKQLKESDKLWERFSQNLQNRDEASKRLLELSPAKIAGKNSLWCFPASNSSDYCSSCSCLVSNWSLVYFMMNLKKKRLLAYLLKEKEDDDIG